MPLWGPKQDETFVIGTGELTLFFTDNQKVAVLRAAGHFNIYIDYTKGTEDEIQIQIETEIKDDTPGGFFIEAARDVNDGKYIKDPIRIVETSRLRIPIPVVAGESKARVSIKAVGSVVTPGPVTIRFATDNLR